MVLDEDKCLVCGSPPHGVHFGVYSCRACAAFFRRTIAIGKPYSCKRGTKSCGVYKGVKNICRFCRYQKCKRIGMVFNEESDLQSPSTSTNNGALQKPSVESPEPVADTMSPITLPEIVISNNKIDYDYQPFVKIVTETLYGNLLNPKPYLDSKISVSPLSRLLAAYRFLDPENFCTVSELEPKEKVDLKILIRELELFLIRAARFAMCNKEFAELLNADKFQVFRHSAMILVYIVRPFWTMQRCGPNVDDRRFVMGESWYVDIDNFDYSTSEWTAKSTNDMNALFKPFSQMIHKNVLTPMRELRVTEKELMFLIAHTLWNVKGVPGLSEQTVQVAERYIDEVTTDLHAYYTFEMRMDSYAVRLTKLVKLLANFQDLVKFKKELMDMADIFHIFSCSLISECLLV
ncbi:hypothetical protein L596_011903 [Steinernema carpocapsae]|uniref:Nuclear receptor domain-containing protein n=1 Tax=Steinernema carpocapsae TaxID=34508 RepID=A0A4V6A4M3_STECR|nr:hypothetical protein L596_011903 [Steinernema carpocapsae]